jgi:hypothetical protein
MEVVVNKVIAHALGATALLVSFLPAASPASADPVGQLLDPLTCEILRGMAPGWPPMFDIRLPDPDVYSYGELIYDCPPYE